MFSPHVLGRGEVPPILKRKGKGWKKEIYQISKSFVKKIIPLSGIL
jgi:hypothetical protein